MNSARWLDSLPREVLLSDAELLRKRGELYAIHGRYDSARALLSGSPTASADDVRAVAKPILRHRIQLNFNAQADRVGVDQVIDELLREIPLEDPSAPGARELDRLVKPAGA